MYKILQQDLTSVDTDALVIGLFQEDKTSQGLVKELNQSLGGVIDSYLEAGDLSFEYKHIAKIFTLNLISPKRLYIVGLGDKNDITSEKVRNTFGKLFQLLQKDKIGDVAFAFDSFVTDELESNVVAENVMEALMMAPFQFDHYKTTGDKPNTFLPTIQIITKHEEGFIARSLDKGLAYGRGTNLARSLVQLPGNVLTATKLAEYAVELANEYEMEYEILDKKDMEELGMGALLAVNQGSDEPPKLIVLKYKGKQDWKDAVALVGKGITFDTGGYSIKTKDGLMGMKTDMGGSAAVLGAMDTIGRLKPKKNVIAVIPATDNMISGGAFKPDDVITSLSGKTIEVRNTDAEGRLALADAITYAKRYNVSRIVDVATLTGGVIVALGDQVTGVMTNDQTFLEEVKQAASYVNEPIWQLPYLDVYKKQVRNSEVADLNNSPGRKGHAVLAGSFVAEFAEDTPWVHLDIAGTAVSSTNYDLGPKGPTGIMARTLAKLIIE
ncbi:leucyl aminopeptidase [Salirhabdus euzebyi]|uniref:Probable cytosol aminopeptidase n=1 Tax=Salirhabdus euzebyi TaxID=394506 RepID=A0A841Q4V5_9BACI|nr:leucyl aminopeptidase [Salirhabdus euzebyi]MBB6453424.1 leucyl aminopeptidase [Salirhabdus euzebyi]